ncbi:ribonuclease H-like domain-containing protein [Paenibacillus humicola]|uniref:ribonuclease H-like domain-containing protein n=1 Tax=Paenibacillus humicola TaxID=3110540 RepID=UPI00237ADB14|nr:ribonuclease H-like domain-containing protein [Paenibacillus humicola]
MSGGLREKLLRLRGAAGQAGGTPEAGSSDGDGRDGRQQAPEYGSADGAGPGGRSAAPAASRLPHGAAEPAAEGRAAAGLPASPGGRAAETPAGAADGEAATLPPEWAPLGVRAARSAEGDFLLRVVRCPLTQRHGIHRLSELTLAAAGLAAFNGRPAPAARAGRGRQGGAATGRSGTEAAVEAEKLLFLDLETTGLGVGAGNIPFMVGIAYSDGAGSFVIEQMLIRHPAEERAMLAYLQDKLPAFTHLVTYNGRTFDWPVVQSRMIMNGFRSFSWDFVHIDLLHPSRSIWRNTLASCKLSRVEEERLGIEREDDVPGSLAPAIYFQFLADGNPLPLLGVFRHNETDMLSLATLAIRFGHLLSERLDLALPHEPEAEELLRTGLWLEKMGAAGAAETLFAKVEADEKAAAPLLCALAERDKKCGNWPRAVVLWQKAVRAAERSSLPGWEAHIELAKYHEHRTRRFDLALAFAEEALEHAQRRYSGMRTDAKRRSELDGIRKRIDRLRAKTGRKSG